MLADSSPMSCFGGRSDVRERFEAANRVNPIDPVRASEPAGRQPRRGKYQLVPPNRRFPRLAAVPVRSDCFVSSLRVGQMPSWLGRLFFLRLDQLGIRQHNLGRMAKGLSRWSARTLAGHLDIPSATVNRILRENKLQPHRLRTFAFSPDPQFGEKLLEVVALYMNPPDNAGALRGREDRYPGTRSDSADATAAGH
jgi:hypothetical protein